MARVTVTIEEEHDEILDELTGEDGEFSSKSAAVRSLIGRYEEIRSGEHVDAQRVQAIRAEYEERISEYEAEIEALETDLSRAEEQVARLQRTNLKILEERDRTQELERYVDEERQRREAGKLRAWWRDWVGGW